MQILDIAKRAIETYTLWEVEERQRGRAGDAKLNDLACKIRQYAIESFDKITTPIRAILTWRLK